MAREFGVSFALGASLDSSFGSSFRAATGQVRGITQSIRDMEQSPVGRLGASLINQQKAIRGTRSELDRARGVLDALRAQADAAGGASGRLAIQIRQAETDVSGLTSRLERQNAAFAETRARASTAGGSLQGLISQYRQLRGEIEAQRVTKARAESGLEVAPSGGLTKSGPARHLGRHAQGPAPKRHGHDGWRAERGLERIGHTTARGPTAIGHAARPCRRRWRRIRHLGPPDPAG